MQDHLNTDKRKWITLQEYVDLETGELITKSESIRLYYIVRKTKKFEENEKYRITKYTYECRRNGQQRLAI